MCTPSPSLLSTFVHNVSFQPHKRTFLPFISVTYAQSPIFWQMAVPYRCLPLVCSRRLRLPQAEKTSADFPRQRLPCIKGAVKNPTPIGVGSYARFLFSLSFHSPTGRALKGRESPTQVIKKKDIQMDVLPCGSHAHHHYTDFRPHPYGMRPEARGLSHGLKICHRHIFTSLRSAGLSIPTQVIKKERHPDGCLSFLVTRTGIEPMLPP